jgi:hypothetical protein
MQGPSFARDLVASDPGTVEESRYLSKGADVLYEGRQPL